MRQTENTEGTQKTDIKKLIKDLKSEDLKVHESAHLALFIAGDEAIPPLMQTVESQDKDLRWEAAKTLAEMRNPALASFLAKNLENKDPDIRWLSAEGLIALGRETLIPLLKELTNYSGTLFLERGAHHVLHDLYWNKLHEGENEYHTKHPLTQEMRALILPIIQALEEHDSAVVSVKSKSALAALEPEAGKSRTTK